MRRHARNDSPEIDGSFDQVAWTALAAAAGAASALDIDSLRQTTSKFYEPPLNIAVASTYARVLLGLLIAESNQLQLTAEGVDRLFAVVRPEWHVLLNSTDDELTYALQVGARLLPAEQLRVVDVKMEHYVVAIGLILRWRSESINDHVQTIKEVVESHPPRREYVEAWRWVNGKRAIEHAFVDERSTPSRSERT